MLPGAAISNGHCRDAMHLCIGAPTLDLTGVDDEESVVSGGVRVIQGGVLLPTAVPTFPALMK